MGVNESEVLEGQIVGGLMQHQRGPIMTVDDALKEKQFLEEFVRRVMKEGVDYGKIPGCGDKPTLLKPGAEKLNEIYGYAVQLEIMEKTEDWRTVPQFFNYMVKCSLALKRDGSLVAEGVGSCNSMESKYRWRESKRRCPACGAETIIKGKEEYGGGWLCHKKQGGCGAKFPDGDQSIEGQAIGRTENPDIADQVNTILKMAKKRALIDATLSATRSSELFTQDIEDMAPSTRVEEPAKPSSQPQNAAGQQAACTSCGVVIPAAVKVFSENKFGTALCRDCQKSAQSTSPADNGTEFEDPFAEEGAAK